MSSDQTFRAVLVVTLVSSTTRWRWRCWPPVWSWRTDSSSAPAVSSFACSSSGRGRKRESAGAFWRSLSNLHGADRTLSAEKRASRIRMTVAFLNETTGTCFQASRGDPQSGW